MLDVTKIALPTELPTISVGPQYALEQQDPLHRHGPALDQLKGKFEKMIRENPKSRWNGKLWPWLESKLKKKPLAPAHYFNEEERKKYVPQIRHGRLYKKKGSPIASKEVMFVIDCLKNIYVKRKKDASRPYKYSYNHASFLSGAPVVAAGKITLNHEGKIVVLKNASGHYRPGYRETAIALKVFQEKGIPIEDINVVLKNEKKSPPMKSVKFLRKFGGSIFT